METPAEWKQAGQRPIDLDVVLHGWVLHFGSGSPVTSRADRSRNSHDPMVTRRNDHDLRPVEAANRWEVDQTTTLHQTKGLKGC